MKAKAKQTSSQLIQYPALSLLPFEIACILKKLGSLWQPSSFLEFFSQIHFFSRLIYTNSYAQQAFTAWH
jgi:hypothetical protein